MEWFIFQFLLSEIPFLEKYNINNFFDYKTYIIERTIDNTIKDNSDGLNEIEKIVSFKIVPAVKIIKLV